MSLPDLPTEAHHGTPVGPDVPAVELRSVSKVYGTGDLAVTALADVNLLVRQGEFLILAGPSGSGKTTLLSIIGCVLSPSAGDALIFGERISGRAEAELPVLRLSYIGYIFQDPHLLPSLTARANVELPLLLRGWGAPEAEAEARTALESVGLGDKTGRKPADLSGGERQRVAVARAIAGRPPLVLADEPTSSLDAHSGHRMIEMLRALALAAGHTVVVVTHDTRIFSLADRIVRIEDGRVLNGHPESDSPPGGVP
jgi:putative ABC transport system ATP-binding protein